MTRQFFKKMLCTGLLGGFLLSSGVASAAGNGDANGDGKVDHKDVELVRNYIARRTRAINLKNADMDGNGKITASDLSAIMQLARRNENSGLKGDVNGDGNVDVYDVTMLTAYIRGDRKSLPNPRNADMNGDGEIDIYDVQLIQKKVPATSTPKPAQPPVEHNPQGRLDQADSPGDYMLHVKGIAFDEDNPNGVVRVHVYVGGGPGSDCPQYEIRADKGHFVFEDTRNIGNQKTGNQVVNVYALNDYGPGENRLIASRTVNIKAPQPVREFSWPIPGYRGNYRPNHSCRHYYPDRVPSAVDIPAPVGTSIYAPADGTIQNKGNTGSRSFGKWFEIRHDDGTITLYAHLSDHNNVWNGKRVSKGELIAKSGNTGGSTGPHLHFEMYNPGNADMSPNIYFSSDMN